MEIMVLLIIWACVCGAIGMFIGDLGDKHNGKTGLALGAVLGPIGWIVVAVLPPDNTTEVKTKVFQPETDTQRKIAHLEAQIAELKRGTKPAAKPPARMSYDDNGQIPTYKLD
ncbi:MAG: hypothetical protein WCP45_13730 [Verrucomicrobiota bacterium]